MKTLNSRQVSQIQRYCKYNGYTWYEGMDEGYVKKVKFIYKFKPKYYWKEAKSYIFHEFGAPRYYCITQDYWERIMND